MFKAFQFLANIDQRQPKQKYFFNSVKLSTIDFLKLLLVTIF